MHAPRQPGNAPTLSALVAGGAGFLGSNLCERLLSSGYRVLCLDNLQTGNLQNIACFDEDRRFGFVAHDICEPLPADIHADIVFNLACAASPPKYQADPVHTMMTSVLGTRNLLDKAVACGARFVQASTSEVYGDPKEHPQVETYHGNVNPCGPRACYDEGKRAAEALCFDYMRTRDADVRVARIFNTYGPRMSPDDGRIVSNFVCQALQDQPLTIYGDGRQTRSLCFVDDLMQGLTALGDLDEAPDAPINLGNPDEFTVLELAEFILAATNSKSTLVYRPLPTDDPTRRRPDITRAQQILNWKPATPIVEGLSPTIAWFADRLTSGGAPVRGTQREVFRPRQSARSCSFDRRSIA
ncbi:MAG TPA: UDP-glucuronic acid decarboxylase family protein [Saliniramus sp.]|nr:UDP-glucuronic acid decarboxylase family protein [Saliniramus sp.]